MADAAGRAGGSSPRVEKQKRGKPIQSGQKKVLINVFNAKCTEFPTLPIRDVVRLVSEETGVSERSIFRARRESKVKGVLTTPNKKRVCKNLSQKYDKFVKDAVRRKVHEFFFKNELPNVDKVLHSVNSDPDLPNFKRSTFHKFLKLLNFEFVKRRRNSILLDREDISVWRREYLCLLKKYRAEGRRVYYLDETWVNEGHTVSKVWVDKTVISKRKAFLDGLSTGLKNPSGKGKRLIILHIGSDAGFVDGGLLSFISKTTKDYHEEMTGEVFVNWFKNVLPLLDEKAVIVMDNASYHSTKVEKIPTKNSRKCDITNWLTEKNVEFNGDMIKAQLMLKVNQCKHLYDKYVIDEMAAESGRIVCRLPPYHCELNPIELVWSQVKGYMARQNSSFKMVQIKDLLPAAISDVTAQKWQECIRHVEAIEKKMFTLDNIQDDLQDRFIINLEASSSDSDLDGIEPFSDADI